MAHAVSHRITRRPLDHRNEVRAVTADLRTANGNLPENRMAELSGISFGQFANWLHEPLTFSERVTRLRAVVSIHRFRKRLRMTNKSFQEKPSLPLMASGDRQLVADLVDDMLRGSPV